MNSDIDNDPVPPELCDGDFVLEAGAYEGAWSKKVCEAKNCTVYAYEPASRAYFVAKKRTKDCEGLVLHPYGIGKQARTDVLCDRDRDGANTFGWNPENEPSETVQIRDAAEEVDGWGENSIAHLNAEGGEVEILERLLEVGTIQRFKLVLVQWHPYDDEMRARIASIVEQMAETHDLERRGPWIAWKRKDIDKQSGGCCKDVAGADKCDCQKQACCSAQNSCQPGQVSGLS